MGCRRSRPGKAVLTEAVELPAVRCGVGIRVELERGVAQAIDAGHRGRRSGTDDSWLDGPADDLGHGLDDDTVRALTLQPIEERVEVSLTDRDRRATRANVMEDEGHQAAVRLSAAHRALEGRKRVAGRALPDRIWVGRRDALRAAAQRVGRPGAVVAAGLDH